jgi:hypothetical protein
MSSRCSTVGTHSVSLTCQICNADARAGTRAEWSRARYKSTSSIQYSRKEDVEGLKLRGLGKVLHFAAHCALLQHVVRGQLDMQRCERLPRSLHRRRDTLLSGCSPPGCTHIDPRKYMSFALLVGSPWG